MAWQPAYGSNQWRNNGIMAMASKAWRNINGSTERIENIAIAASASKMKWQRNENGSESEISA